MVAVDGGTALDTAVDEGAVGILRASNFGNVGKANWLGAAHGQSIGVGVSTLVRQMVGSGRIAPSDGAFLEMSFEDITARERVLAEVTHVRSVARICHGISESSRLDLEGTHV